MVVWPGDGRGELGKHIGGACGDAFIHHLLSVGSSLVLVCGVVGTVALGYGEIDDVLASQRQMLVRRGKPDGSDDARMAQLFRKHLDEVAAALGASPAFDVMYVTYEEVVRDPTGQARAVSAFVGGGLDADGMARIVEPGLHRQQGGS